MTTIINKESLNYLRAGFESANFGRFIEEAEHLALARSFFGYVPEFSSASHDLKCEVRNPKTYVMRDFEAVRQPWFTADSKHLRRTIALDIDHTDGLDQWLSLPANRRPHLVVDPWSGRSCAIFVLDRPVDYSSSNSSDMDLVEKTVELLADFFDATPIARHVAHKNPVGLTSELGYPLKRRTAEPGPLYESWLESGSEFIWITHKGRIDHDLQDLHDFFDGLAETYEAQQAIDADYRKTYRLKKQIRSNRSTQEQIEDAYETGRNDGVWTELRFWAYRNYPNCLDAGVIEAKCDELNNALSIPMDQVRVASIAKRVRLFMVNKYTPSGRTRDVNFGIMQLYKTDFKLATKQSLSAARTNRLVPQKTLETLKIAAAGWSGGKMTQAALAKRTGLSLRTVKTYWHSIGQ